MQSKTEELTGTVSVHGFFDFGLDAFGTLEVELDGQFAENTEVVIGEVARDGKIIHEPGFKTFIQQIFQLKNGHHCYRFHIQPFIPAYDGFPHCHAPKEAGGEVAPFRYVEVNRYYGRVILRRTAWFGDWNDDASSFSCSEPDLNRVWEFCRYSIKATTLFDCYVDGERERMPYEGDAYINQLGHFCCDANYRLAQNTIRHFLEQGRFTWPTEWLLLTPLIVRDYLLYSGDWHCVQQWMPLLEEKLLARFMTSEGLLSPAQFEETENADIWDKEHRLLRRRIKDLIDWPETERDHYEQGKVNFVPNAYLYAALLTMADLTGNPEYTHRAANLKAAIRRHFLKNGLFADSVGSSHTSLHSAMFALLFNLAEDKETARLKNVLLSRGMACSVYGAQFLLDACYKCALEDHAISLMTSRSERGWFNMMDEGATITMESWGDRWKMNQDWNHPWGTAPANIIPRRLCGIRPLKPGFERFVVEPHPGKLASFDSVQPTIHGPIRLHYIRQEGFDLSVPDGTEALYRGKCYAPGRHHLA